MTNVALIILWTSRVLYVGDNNSIRKKTGGRNSLKQVR
jgi:hypothetical protein